MRLPWQVSSLEHARALAWELARRHIAAFHIKTQPAAEEHLRSLEELPSFLLQEPAIEKVSLHFWAVGQTGSLGADGQVGIGWQVQVGKPMLLGKGLAHVHWLKLKTHGNSIHVIIPGTVSWKLLRLDSAECLEMVFRDGAQDAGEHTRQNNSNVDEIGAVRSDVESMGPEAVLRHHFLTSHTDSSPGAHACMLCMLCSLCLLSPPQRWCAMSARVNGAPAHECHAARLECMYPQGLKV